MILILDLDDTIFSTQSISRQIVEPAVQILRTYYTAKHGIRESVQLIDDLWKYPFDSILQKYQIPINIQEEFFFKLDNIEYNLNIQPFEDYYFVQQLQVKKYLVTTGFVGLQKAKIKALNIQNDFVEVYIDDPRDNNRIFKKGIFEKIVEHEKIAAKKVWVIGDNPDSELIAGNSLGMNTIQRLGRYPEKPPYVDYGMNSFEELNDIIKCD